MKLPDYSLGNIKITDKELEEIGIPTEEDAFNIRFDFDVKSRGFYLSLARDTRARCSMAIKTNKINIVKSSQPYFELLWKIFSEEKEIKVEEEIE